MLKYTAAKAEESGRNGKQQTVNSIHHTAVAGNEVAVILKPCHALYKRCGKIADLTEARADQSGQHAAKEREVKAALQSKVQTDAGKRCGDCTGNATLNSLVGADLGSKLVFTEPFATEESEGVAYPG